MSIWREVIGECKFCFRLGFKKIEVSLWSWSDIWGSEIWSSRMSSSGYIYDGVLSIDSSRPIYFSSQTAGSPLPCCHRFIPIHAKLGPLPLLASAFQWHNETGELYQLRSNFASLAFSRQSGCTGKLAKCIRSDLLRCMRRSIVNIHTHFIPTVFLIGFFIPVSSVSTLSHPPLPFPSHFSELTLIHSFFPVLNLQPTLLLCRPTRHPRPPDFPFVRIKLSDEFRELAFVEWM